jgi:hypothetical protein
MRLLAVASCLSVILRRSNAREVIVLVRLRRHVVMVRGDLRGAGTGRPLRSSAWSLLSAA